MNNKAIEITYENCRTSSKDYRALIDLKNRTILITGGTGFVGKWLAEMVCYLNFEHKLNIKLYLLARDIDSFIEEVPHLASNPSINLIKKDIRHISEIPSDVNFIINAAGSPDNREHISNPLKVIDTFYNGTNALFDSAIRLPEIVKIIHLSSNYVYGSISIDTIKESDMGILNCNSYNSTYAEVKRLTETLCSIYINQKQLPIIILRPFSFFGPYQKLDKPWAINNFIRDALNGGPIKIIGDGSVSRSYLYGSDLAFWLLKILITKNDINIYNIGSANEITLKELAELIKEVINDDIKIVERTSGFNNHVNNCSIPNIELLLKNIDLVENFTLIENLRNSINWLLINRRK